MSHLRKTTARGALILCPQKSDGPLGRRRIGVTSIELQMAATTTRVLCVNCAMFELMQSGSSLGSKLACSTQTRPGSAARAPSHITFKLLIFLVQRGLECRGPLFNAMMVRWQAIEKVLPPAARESTAEDAYSGGGACQGDSFSAAFWIRNDATIVRALVGVTFVKSSTSTLDTFRKRSLSATLNRARSAAHASRRLANAASLDSACSGPTLYGTISHHSGGPIENGSKNAPRCLRIRVVSAAYGNATSFPSSEFWNHVPVLIDFSVKGHLRNPA